MPSSSQPHTTSTNESAPEAGTPVAGSIESSFTGENSGQIAVGSNIVQWTVHGDFVEAAEAPARPRPRATPVSVLPKPMHGFLDRDAERAAALRAMESAMTVELCGEPGEGKTALLRHLAHTSAGAFCRDGIVFLDDPDESLDDLLQYIYDTFFEYEIPYKPNEAEVRLALADKCALVLLDEVALSGEDLERLTNAVPRSTLVVAGDAPRIAGEVETVPLPGLPLAEALLLMQSALGRMLEPSELDVARTLWESTKGNPGRLVRAARRARAEGTGLVVEDGTPEPGGGAPSAAGTLGSSILGRSLGALTETQRRVVATLDAFGRTFVAAPHVAAIAGVPAAATVLEELVERELAEERDGMYRLVADVHGAVLTAAEEEQIRERAIAHFAAPHGLDQRRDVAAVLLTAGWALGSTSLARAMPLVAWSDGVLALSGRWDARARLLRRTVEAARGAGDRAVEAWALHQSGSRSLVLGRSEEATTTLREALRLREETGDVDGAEVTRHNLAMLLPQPAPVDHRSMRTAFILIGAALVALVALLLFLRGRGEVAAPVALSAARTLDDSTVVQLSWEDRADNEDGFAVERSPIGGAFREIGRAPAAQTFFADRDVDPATTYVYRVRAFSGETFSRYSNLDTVPGLATLPSLDVPAGSPRLEVDTTAIDFGIVSVDSVATRTLAVANAGTAPMILVLTSPEPPFAITDSATSMQLEPGMRQTITLRYAPTAGRPQQGVLLLDTPDDSLGPVAVRLVGTGVGERTESRFASALFEQPLVASGATTRLEVRFDGPVAEDAVIALRASDRDVIVPPSLTLRRGRDRASVVVAMPAVVRQRTVRVGATYGGRTIVASAVVSPPSTPVALVELLLGERSVEGGTMTKARLRLSAPAPRGGVDVALLSSSPAALVPPRVRVAEGSTSAGFAVATRPVRTKQTATITAAVASGQISSALVILPAGSSPPTTPPTAPPALFRLSLRPASNVLDVPRSGGQSSATVGISRGLRGGVSVLLESSQPKLVIVPASVTIAPGATTAEFSFAVRPPAAATSVIITARVVQPSAATTTAAITVQPQQVILR